MQENTVLDKDFFAEEIVADTTVGELYSLWDIGIGALLGTPLAGAYFITHNATILAGKKPNKAVTWLLGICLYLLPWLSGAILPARVVLLSPIISIAAIPFYANRTQGAAISNFLEKGGSRKSVQNVLGFSALFLLLAFMSTVCLLILAAANADDYGR